MSMHRTLLKEYHTGEQSTVQSDQRVKQMHHLLLLFVAGLELASATPSAAGATCTRPDAEQFLEASRTSIGFTGSYFPNADAIFLPAQRNSQWMGTSWEGPRGGVLFLLDCGGKELAHVNLGATESLKTGPLIPAGQTAEVLFNSEYGTGVLGSDVTLLLAHDNSIKTVWRHVAKQVNANGDFQYEDQYRWNVSADRTRIAVTGHRKVDATKDPDHVWAPGTTHELPSEQYCWNATQEKFLVCK